MDFVVPSLDSSSSSSNKELLDEIDAKHQIAVQAIIACVNTWEFFNQWSWRRVVGNLWTLT
jgi:hypothetical protein